jgi:Flp pilus assembly protein TadG
LTSARVRRDARRATTERGAAAVEFALVFPLLILLVFGVVEFGAAWSQSTDVRHGAREAARLAAVDYNPLDEAAADQINTIIAAACSRMGSDSGASIEITLETAGADDVGDVGVVTLVQPFSSITGFVPISSNLTSSIDFRLERPASWAETAGPVPC